MSLPGDFHQEHVIGFNVIGLQESVLQRALILGQWKVLRKNAKQSEVKER